MSVASVVFETIILVAPPIFKTLFEKVISLALATVSDVFANTSVFGT